MDAPGRPRRIGRWLAAFAGIALLCLGTLSYFLYARGTAVGAILAESREKGFTVGQTIDNLGGRELAAHHCKIYVSMPDSLSPPDLKKEACFVLGKCGRDGVPGLLALIEHPDPFVRSAATGNLGAIGQEASCAIPALLRSCEKLGDSQVMMVQEALMLIGTASADDLDELLDVSRSDKPNVRLLALHQIGGIRPLGRAALSRLRLAASDRDAFIRRKTALVLALIDGKSPETRKVIEGLASDDDEDVRTAAAEALRKIREATAPPYAYVNAPICGSLAIVSRAKQTTTAVLGTQSYPHGISASPDGRWVAVSNHSSATISVVDTRTKKIVKTLEAGRKCIQLAFHPSGQTLWTVNQGDEQIQVNAVGDDWKRLARIPVGKVPHQLAFTHDGSVAVAPCRTTLYFLDTEKMKVARTLELPAAGKTSGLRVVAATNGPTIFASHYRLNRVYIIDALTTSIRAEVPTGKYPLHMALTRDGRTLYTSNRHGNSVTAIDCVKGQARATVDVGQQPMGMTLNRDESRLYVSNFSGKSLSVVNVAANKLCATVRLPANPYKVHRWPGTGLLVSVNHAAKGSISLVKDASQSVQKTIPLQIRYPVNVVFSR